MCLSKRPLPPPSKARLGNSTYTMFQYKNSDYMHARELFGRLYLMAIFVVLPVLMLSAQTPFDSFSPETSRVILDKDDMHAEQQRDTTRCVLVADISNSRLLFIDVPTQISIGTVSMSNKPRRWLSVDPLADKNPSTSPYMYCSGNPIVHIDPDGMDEWDFDIKGNVVNHTENKNVDIIRYVDNNGCVRTNGEGLPMENSYAYGSLNVSTGDGYTIIKASNDNTGESVFEFMTQSGIVNEWTLLQTGDVGIGTNFISTAHKPTSDNSYLKVPQTFPFTELRTQTHNHPKDGALPSGIESRINRNGIFQAAGTWGDMGVKKNQQRWGNSVVFRIYLPSSQSYVSF